MLGKASLWLLGLTVAIGCEQGALTEFELATHPQFLTTPPPTAGKIVVNHDEWTLSDFGFARAPDAATFALNVASWFTGGTLGSFLVYSNNFGLVESSLANTMTAAGHGWTVLDPATAPLPNLSPFDAVFVAGNTVNNQALIDYVDAGGNVYVAGGTAGFPSAAAEAAAWNVFLNQFGLNYGAPYDLIRAVLPITSTHPIFVGVGALYQDHGNPVNELDPSDPNTDILEFSGGAGLYGVFELVAAPNAAPIANAGPDQLVDCTGAATSVTLNGSGSSDPDGDELTYTWKDSGGNIIAMGVNPIITIGLGVHTITLAVSDGELEDTDDVEIHVADTTPPEISLVLLEDELWPPNHKMRLVARVSAADPCDDSPELAVTVSSNEPIDGLGDGNATPDWEVVARGNGTFDVSVRAERSGKGTARVYTIVATATDASLNEAEVTATVTVPHDRGRRGKKE